MSDSDGSGGGSVRVTIDPALCVGNGTCELIAPDLFVVGEDGIAQLLIADLSGEHVHRLEEAAGACPTAAIDVEVAK